MADRAGQVAMINGGPGRRFRVDECDVTDEQQTNDWLSAVEAAFGTVTLGICKAAIVEQEKPGRVVFLGSWATDSVHTHIPAYCVSKAGLRMLCRSMAVSRSFQPPREASHDASN